MAKAASAMILVVDDEPVLASTLALIFRQAGYAATAVNSGEEALASIATSQPSLVVTDVVMPGMNGVTLAKTIRVSCPKCPILIFSGNADTQALLEAAQKEGHSFEVLAKPVPPPLMLAKVASLLEQKAAAHAQIRMPMDEPQTLSCHPMQTVFEAAGGIEGLRRLAYAWHKRVMADDVVAHAFSHGFHPQHVERLAAYWAEALGGPSTYSDRYGTETAVVKMHSGNGEHDEMDRRAIACFDSALADVGLANNQLLRQVLHDYFAWATTTTMSQYRRSAGDVPTGLKIPHWSWNGLEK